ncbi:MAG: hypothetical protein A3G34_05750 [Candidatus Lindowbacteria bacterium RIFCSPLOWO2_12_FULL_62_27]|nr:MAG: hypothetical protein A3G34_05750 [Candidatus Lindowbacteria bacterium RIFCSPLOWO2_12_FULL_62_27]
MPVTVARGLSAYSEIFDPAGEVRPLYRPIMDYLKKADLREFRDRFSRADQINIEEGVTFLLRPGEERILKVDWIPRIIESAQFDRIREGLIQRATAINLFLNDLYTGRQDVVPEDVIRSSLYYYPACMGFTPPRKIYLHIYGPDLVRMDGDTWYILEDNIRIPSGVSYALKYREIAKRLFPDFLSSYDIYPVHLYPHFLRKNLEYIAPPSNGGREPVAVLLTEGSYNAAYYDHKYLAEETGVSLCVPKDLFVDDEGFVQMRTNRGNLRVDVIYRRIQDIDDFVPNLSKSYIAGKVNLANAWGTGVLDDKGTFPFVPKMIRRYLDQDPILPNAPTYSPLVEEDLKYILSNFPRMVIKCREGYGGHGIWICPEATKDQQEEWRREMLANPLNFIAQDCLDFSTHCLTRFTQDDIVLDDTYVDLRTYVLMGEKVQVMPGGISRVAPLGTRVVNSSSGGLIKDTWVLR